MKCPSTNVVVSQAILVNNVPHAGVVTHVCTLEKGHAPEFSSGTPICKCNCGQTWVTNVK